MTNYPKKHCAHCSAPFEPKTAFARFCSPAHNTAFQNRRNQRGAILYDLWMTNRHDRGLAKTLKVLHVMTRLAMHWYEQDRRHQTWNDARDTVASVPWAEATIVARNAAGNRR